MVAANEDSGCKRTDYTGGAEFCPGVCPDNFIGGTESGNRD